MILKFVAFRGKSLVSKAIRFWTRSKGYSHIAILMPNERLIEAWPHKGGIKSWTDWSDWSAHTPGTKYEIWELSVSEEIYDYCISYYEKAAAEKIPYDWAGIIAFVFKTKDRKNKMFCSEIAVTPVVIKKRWIIDPAKIHPALFVDIMQIAGAECSVNGIVI